MIVAHDFSRGIVGLKEKQMTRASMEELHSNFNLYMDMVKEGQTILIFKGNTIMAELKPVIKLPLKELKNEILEIRYKLKGRKYSDSSILLREDRDI